MIYRLGYFAALTTIFVLGQADLLMLAALSALPVIGLVSLVAVLLKGPEALLDIPITELGGLRRPTH